MDGQAVKGLLLGCVLGLGLWIAAGIAILYKVGSLPRMLVYFWWLFGILMTCVGVELARTSLRGRPGTSCLPRRTSPS